MKSRAAAVTLVTAALVVSLVLVSNVSAAPRAARGPAQPTWQVLVYLDADNNLDVNAGPRHQGIVQIDLDELMAIGSQPAVAVYALVDRWEGPANLFKVNEGSLVELTDFPMNGQETNMGDPATLRSFVSYASQASKAAHTLLIFWDHGTPQYVAWDDNPQDMLTHWEVIAALKGYHVDIIATDECLVGQIEVAYEYSTGLSTDFLVASETYTGWRGLPYDEILAAIVSDPGISERELAVTIVERTQEMLSEPPYMGEQVNSHGAIDLDNVPGLVEALGDLTDLLIPTMKADAGMVTSARAGAAVSYGNAAIDVIDLERFVKNILASSDSERVRNACLDVLEAFTAAVVSLQITQSTDRMVGGLGINFPEQSWAIRSYYDDYAFAGSGWLDLLEAYWAACGNS